MLVEIGVGAKVAGDEYEHIENNIPFSDDKMDQDLRIVDMLLRISSLVFQSVHFAIFGKQAYDFRYCCFHHSTACNQVIFVDIDKNTLDHLGSWPLPRDVLGGLAAHVDAIYPKAVGWSIYFPCSRKEENGHWGQDEDFAKILGKCRSPQIVSCYLLKDKNPGHPPFVNKAIYPNSAESFRFDAFGEPMLGVVPTLPIIAQNASAQAFNNNRVDHDGVVRTVPLVLRWQDTLIMPVAMAMLSNSGCKAALLPDGHGGFDQIIVDGKMIPTDVLGNMFVNFAEVPHISAWSILSGAQEAFKLRDKYVVLGSTEGAKNDEAFGCTSDGRKVSGGMITAATLDTILSGESILVRPYWADLAVWLLFIALSLLSLIMAFPMTHRRRFTIFLCLFFGYGLFNCWYLFMIRHWVIDLTLPLAVVVANYGLLTLGAARRKSMRFSSAQG